LVVGEPVFEALGAVGGGLGVEAVVEGVTRFGVVAWRGVSVNDWYW
jgi:hypothetical protein